MKNTDAAIVKESALQKALGKLDFLFVWTRLFYPGYRGMKNYQLLLYIVPQRLLLINAACSWPVHRTSRVLFANKVTLGKFSGPGASNGCYVQAKNGIHLGHNVRIGPNVGLISANHNPDNYDEWLEDEPIRIGDNVWIGMGAVILPGITIGDNVIIAANSVVNKDIPSNSIAGGVPCKVLREKPPYTGLDYSTI